MGSLDIVSDIYIVARLKKGAFLCCIFKKSWIKLKSIKVASISLDGL